MGEATVAPGGSAAAAISARRRRGGWRGLRWLAMENDTIQTPDTDTADELVESELLVEEISIDGMCGVY
jgi:mycofactocin precursor